MLSQFGADLRSSGSQTAPRGKTFKMLQKPHRKKVHWRKTPDTTLAAGPVAPATTPQCT